MLVLAVARVDEWRRLGFLTTIGHVADFLDSNPELIPRGALTGPYWDQVLYRYGVAATLQYWLNGCLQEPETLDSFIAWREGP